MKRCVFLLFLFLALILKVDARDILHRHAISYEGGDRFGDRLLIYAQARYLSYMTAVPFLYRPFIYSDRLSIEWEARPFDQYASQYTHVFHITSNQTLTEFFAKIR